MLKKLHYPKEEVIDLSIRKVINDPSFFRLKNQNFLKFLGALFLFIFMSFSANAQTSRYWSGGSGTSDNIDQGSNWFNGNPSAGDNLYFNNTSGSRHWAYSNYGASSYFNFFITYNGAAGIKLYGDNTYALKFENNSDSNVLELSPSSAAAGSREIGNRIGYDLEINPVGSGGILVSCDKISMDNTTASRNLKVYGSNTLTVNGSIYDKNGTGATLQLLGTATVELKGTSSYSGLTTINGGILKLNAAGGALKSGNDVSIAGGTLRVMQSQTIHNLSISTGTLLVDAGVTLTITGTLTNAGTITNVGTITNSGIINNTGTITNTGSIKNTSNASSTGYLLSNGSTANVTQEHYLTSNQRGWRYLSNPLSTITFGTLASSSTTAFTLGATASGAYDSTTNTWSSGADANSLEAQKAYKVFIRGRSSEVTGLVYSVHPPSHVTVSIAGTATNAVPTAITTTAGKFYLVANPYTAPVSVSSILGASSGLSGTVSYYNPTKASSGSGTDLEKKFGGYDAVAVSGGAGSSTDVVIPPMGAIFVQATSSGTINIPKLAIYTGTVTSPAGNFAHKTTNSKTVTPPTALTINVSSNGVDYDKLQLQFKEVGTSGSNIDFGKLPNTILDFYSIDDASKNWAVSELELKEQTIPLGITSTALQGFRFNIAENSIPSGFEASLVDNLLNTKTVLVKGTNYDFNIDATTTSHGNARFAIALKASSSLSVKNNELDSKIVMWPNPAHNQFYIINKLQEGETTFNIYSISGQLIHTEKSSAGSTTTINTNGWSAGMYILNASNNGNKTTKQLLIQ